MDVPRQLPPPTFTDRRHTFLAIALSPALSAVVFCRHHIGCNMTGRLCYFVMATAFIWLPYWWTGHYNVPFVVFAILMMGATAFHHFRHKRDMRLYGGTYPPSSFGVSYLEFLPLPRGLIYRVLDPFLVMAAGYLVLRTVSFGLGEWICLSGLAIGFEEINIKMSNDAAFMQDLDSVYASQVHRDNIERHTGTATAARFRSNALPTGLD